MDRYEDDQPVDLREYLSVIRARKTTILLVTLLVAGLSLGLSLMQEPQYTAQVRVLVESSVPFGSTSLIPPEVNLDTEQEIAASEPVAVLVLEDLHLDRSIDSLLSGLNVEGLTETEVLRISYSSPDPALARDAANSFAENYIQFRQDQAIEGIQSNESALQQQVDAASDQLAQVEQDLQAAEDREDETLVSALGSQRNILISRLGLLQQRLGDIQVQRSLATKTGQIIEPASLPRAPSSPNYSSNIVLGGFLGLAIGVALAFVRERLDDRFKGRADVEKAIEGPVLGAVSKFKIDKSSPASALITSSSPTGTISEAYRSLRTNLQFIAGQSKFKSFLITSASAGEGKSVTAANLAVVMAQAGNRVIVVSADLRRPTIEGYFNVSRRGAGGLSTWLLDPEGRPPQIVDPGIPNVRLIPCGPLPTNPAELLTSRRFPEFIEFLEDNADFVIFDSPPVLAVADATVLASHLGGIVLVIDASKTLRSATVHAKQELQRVGGRVVGAVLNNFDWSVSPYYYGPYDYSPSVDVATTNGEPDANALDGKVRRRRRIFQRT